ncbi:MAG TPA: carboxymuconolactone decarboxylase family protein [Candidatus Acidoferrales bacterium]|nr:carboxymuconolactone decarboxylase family protein [Candidatus Acidoferrales bacterium]
MNFPERYNRLQALIGELNKEASGTVGGFTRLHQAATAAGTLDKKTKELISLAIGIAVHCEGCIAYHVHDALAAGANRAEIVETIGVAVMMGGGPGLMYGCEALEALDQFTSTPAGA